MIERLKELTALLQADSIDEAVKVGVSKDIAYLERNLCVLALASLARQIGWRVGIAKHEGGNWEDAWRNVVYIDLPTGQVSWHIHDSELPSFAFLPQYPFVWDGHTTEEKYRRLGNLRLLVAPQDNPEDQAVELLNEINNLASAGRLFATPEDHDKALVNLVAVALANYHLRLLGGSPCEPSQPTSDNCAEGDTNHG